MRRDNRGPDRLRVIRIEERAPKLGNSVLQPVEQAAVDRSEEEQGERRKIEPLH